MPARPQSRNAQFLEIQTATAWGRVLADFSAWISPTPGVRALDIGSGPGLLPSLLTQKGCRALGLDLDINGLAHQRLHQDMIAADAGNLPFSARSFDLVTATNLLFLLPEPLLALREMVRLLGPNGKIALINPSERMSLQSALSLAEERSLQGLARQSLLNWASTAERHNRWSEAQLKQLFSSASIRLIKTDLRVGPGLARFACGVLS